MNCETNHIPLLLQLHFHYRMYCTDTYIDTFNNIGQVLLPDVQYPATGNYNSSLSVTLHSGATVHLQKVFGWYFTE